jgi:demethylmenaquinone methyltransferase / 2-methoxy-6-polyprenyl-1,4-benzoquinol methylase
LGAYFLMKADNRMEPGEGSAKERASQVQAMFDQIAPRYDLMNRLMTGGQDINWRKQVIRYARIPAGGRVLDLGTGTGDLSREALRQSPECQPVAADFTLAMMQAGKKQPGPQLHWSCADALNLPFPAEMFDAVVSGFLLRNVTDLCHALKEQYRVLRPGGRIVTLDTTRPRPNLLSPLIRFHMHQVIPFLGGMLTGSRDAYVYLPSTSENFLPAEALRDMLEQAGFQNAAFRRLMFGTIAIHWAEKPVGV